MIVALLTYLAWLPAIFGFGIALVRLIRRFSWLRPPKPSAADLIIAQIAGFAVIGMLVDAVNWITAIDPVVSTFLFIVGWLLFVFDYRFIREAARPSSPYGWIHVSLMIFAVLIIVATSVQPTLPLSDAALYHIQTIRWITSSPLVPGLANLHGRFGFNSVWFSIAAALELPMLVGKSPVFVNGVLFAAYGIPLGLFFLQWNRRKLTPSTVFLLLTVLAWLVLTIRAGTSTPKNDLPIALFTIIAVYFSLRAIEAQEAWPYETFWLLFISVFSIVIKLSAFPLLVAPAGIFAYRAYRRSTAVGFDQFRKAFVLGIVVSAIIVGVWVARGVGLSGCLLYPVAPTCMPALGWSVTWKQAQDETASIQNWGRSPGITDEAHLRNWFPNWFASKGMPLVKSYGLLSAVGFGLWLIFRRLEHIPELEHKMVPAPIFILPIITVTMGLIYWFWASPDPRFGNGYLLSIALLFLSLGLYQVYLWRFSITQRLIAWISPAAAILVILVLLAVGKMAYGAFVVRKPLLSWAMISQVESRMVKSANGYDIAVPLVEGFCWDTPIPCTPRVDPTLIVDTNDSGRIIGFRVR